jgi:hypothetical protein
MGGRPAQGEGRIAVAFFDVCALVGSPTPADVDKMGMLSRSGGEALRDPLLVCCQLDSAYTLGGSWRKVCAAISHKPRSRRCEYLGGPSPASGKEVRLAPMLSGDPRAPEEPPGFFASPSDDPPPSEGVHTIHVSIIPC